ncbi:MAG: CHAT domain-containing protein, partial [Actinomycetia bacterium]|nr:CHAT domain-containing protein [Actinomycetes bacterium]
TDAEPGRLRRRGSLRRQTAIPDDPFTAVLEQRAEEFEAELVRNPIEPSPPDPEIMHRVRMFAANHPGTCIVRYFPDGKWISAFVVRGQSLDVVRCGRAETIARLAAAMPTDRAPGRREAKAMWTHTLRAIWPYVGADDLAHLVVVPTDDMFTIPLQLAHVDEDRMRPLGAVVPLSFSVSATAFVSRARHLLRHQAVDDHDDLAAVVLPDTTVTGDELIGNGWKADRIVIAGTPPPGLPGDATVHPGTWEGMARLAECKPEFFVYAGHGNIVKGSELGPYLWLDNDIITQFDVALRVRLPRNKLTVIGACLAGQGAQSGGGEVAGFLRSLMAAGAGAIALPLWSVVDGEIVRTIRALLSASRRAAGNGGGIFDVVGALHSHYVDANGTPSFRDRRLSADVVRAETMPLALYL